MIGVYKIENIATKQLYIGSSIRLTYRERRHFTDLARNIHHSPYLQRAFNKYGRDSFVFSIIECCDEKSLLVREQYWLDTLKPQYNNSKVAGNTIGVKHRAEVVEENKKRNSGFGNGNAKLKEADLPDILKEALTSTTVELARKYGVHRNSIERLMRRFGVRKAKVYSLQGRKRLSKLAQNRKNKAIPILQFSTDDVFIAKHLSAIDAWKACGVSVAQILECCHGRIKKPRRFRFTFEKPA